LTITYDSTAVRELVAMDGTYPAVVAIDNARLEDPASYSVDVYVFGTANHEPVVIGTADSGFQIWCPRCDLVGKRVYGSFDVAQQYVARLRKDIAQECRSARRGA
jgi:hypothetical protein